MDHHNHRVRGVAADVRRFQELKRPFRIYHGSTNSTRPFRKQDIIDTSGFSNIIKIDDSKKTALVEPNVSMEQLVDATLRQDMVPAIVPEFPAITVGGAFSGLSGESSSFRYGVFDSTVLWIEIVLGDGSVVTASDGVRSDLLQAAAGSMGTLGVVTLLEVQLVPAKSWVELTYIPRTHIRQAADSFNELHHAGVDYMDGIVFSKSEIVVIGGKLTGQPSPDISIQRFRGARDPWFYLHAREQLVHADKPSRVAVPIKDYLFRYDRGAFWVGSYAYKYFLTPFNWVTRWLLDPLMHTKVMYHALHESGFADRHFVQDVSIPYNHAEEMMNYLHSVHKIYPLWLCPIKLGKNMRPRPLMRSIVEHPREPSDMLLNFGIWGPGPSRPDDFLRMNQNMERLIYRFRGFKILYAFTYYTEDEFWTDYDRTEYDLAREKYTANNLPNVFDKVRVKPTDTEAGKSVQSSIVNAFWRMWPMAGLYGVLKVILRSDYLRGS